MKPVKILRGKQSNLPNTLTDGYIYVCTDTMNVFIDYLDDGGQVKRGQINANNAQTVNSYNVVISSEPPTTADDTTITFVV